MMRPDGGIVHLKKTFPWLPTIAVSGGSHKVGVDCLRMAQFLGADRILRKPVRIAELLEVIRDLELGGGTGAGTDGDGPHNN